jgi:protein-S-isoprenylcysteine O-methyltransferase Ste14
VILGLILALASAVATNLAFLFIVFREPIGSGAAGITARFLAFCLVIAGAALMPAPMRTAPDAASAPGRQQPAVPPGPLRGT